MMPLKESPLLSVRVRGPLAVFRNPAFKVERISFPVITPAAARGIIEAVLWKPAVRWHIERIRVLSPIRFIAFRHNNKVNQKASLPRQAMTPTHRVGPYLVDDHFVRPQPSTVALRDVDYIIEARFSLTERAGPDDKPAKFVDMFRRRIVQGQYFHQPYLGCREFVANILSAENAPTPITETRSLGLMLWDLAYDDPLGHRPIFFAAELQNGVMEVPLEPPMLQALRTHALTA